MTYCAHRGIKVPQELSLLSMDPDRTFAWCTPEISHIDFDSQPLLRRVMNWTKNISRGKEDLRMVTVDANFIQGGTISKAR